MTDIEKALVMTFENSMREDCWKKGEDYKFVFKMVKFIKESEEPCVIKLN